MTQSSHTPRIHRSILCQRTARPIAGMSDEYTVGSVDPSHRHPRAQLLYAITGVMSVITQVGAFVVHPHTAVWIPAGAEHEVRFCSPTSLRTLYIDPSSSAGLPERCCVFEVSELLRALIVEATQLPADYDMAGREGRIVALIFDELARMRSTPLDAPMPRDERLARMCRALLRDPAQEGCLDQLAQVAGMSRRTLTRRFRHEMGMTLSAWHQQVRLLEALARLSAGVPVTRVALDVGYRSPSAFTAVFRRAFGATPSEQVAAARSQK